MVSGYLGAVCELKWKLPDEVLAAALGLVRFVT